MTNDSYDAADATGTLVIDQATATLAFGPLTFVFDGTAKSASVTTTPPNLAGVAVTYNRSFVRPSAIGDYLVQAALLNANYTAAPVTATMTIHAFDITPPVVTAPADTSVLATDSAGASLQARSSHGRRTRRAPRRRHSTRSSGARRRPTTRAE